MKQFTLDTHHAAKEIIWSREHIFFFSKVLSSKTIKYVFYSQF